MTLYLRTLGILGCVVAFLWAVPLHVVARPSFPPKPNRPHFYVDQASLIEASERVEIDRVARELLQEEQVALIVATIPSLLDYNAGGFSIQQYAQALFDHWGVGSKERNYGMLLLVSRGDRKGSY